MPQPELRQLDPQDAVFLAMETPETPAQIGGLAVLDPRTVPGAAGPRLDFERFRDFVAARTTRCARLGWRIQHVPFGLDLPYWVADPDFDAREHVHRAALPTPGGARELAELASRLFASPLHRDRPLWEMFLIEGLQGERAALLWKLNHCLMDGVSGAGLAPLLFDLQPEPAEGPGAPVGDEVPGRPASWLDMTRRGARNALHRRLSVGHQLLGALRLALESRPAVAASPPRASFNGFVGARRAVAWSRISLAEVKVLKQRLGVTVNDVVLALTSGSVRHYLEGRGELPDRSLRALMPMSTRAQGDGRVGNQLREVAVPWATDVACPIERLLAIHAGSKAGRARAEAGGLDLVRLLAEGLPPVATRAITRGAAVFADRAPLPGNAVVSNVRMTDFPLYVAGARVECMVPMSVLAPTQGLNITAVSYCGEIHFGITADPDRVAEPWSIAEGIPKALVELQQAASAWEKGAA